MRNQKSVEQMIRGEEGSQLVEMVLALFVLLALLLGTIEFAMAFLAYNEVTDAAREAARWAMVRGDTSCANTPGLSNCGASPSAIQSYVQSMGYPMLIPSNISVSTTWYAATTSIPTGSTLTTTTWSNCSGTCPADPGNQVQVRVSYNLPIFVNFWNSSNGKFAITGSTLKISSTATQVVSQ